MFFYFENVFYLGKCFSTLKMFSTFENFLLRNQKNSSWKSNWHKFEKKKEKSSSLTELFTKLIVFLAFHNNNQNRVRKHYTLFVKYIIQFTFNLRSSSFSLVTVDSANNALSCKKKITFHLNNLVKTSGNKWVILEFAKWKKKEKKKHSRNRKVSNLIFFLLFCFFTMNQVKVHISVCKYFYPQ